MIAREYLVWMKYTRVKSPTEARQRESGAFDKSLCIPMEILVRVQIFIKRGWISWFVLSMGPGLQSSKSQPGNWQIDFNKYKHLASVLVMYDHGKLCPRVAKLAKYHRTGPQHYHHLRVHASTNRPKSTPP